MGFEHRKAVNATRPRWYRSYVLAVLTLLNILNLWHRYLLYNLSAVSEVECTGICDDVPFVPLCQPCSSASSAADEMACFDCQTCRLEHASVDYNLKDGACIDNTSYGYLAGFAFTVMFAFVGLCAGYCSDRLDRRLVHTTAVLVWSLAAAGHGTCSSFRCLLLARILVGVGEAFNAPCCYAVIAYYFSPEQRATANGIYSTGTYVGAAVSSLCIFLAGAIGWRTTAFVSGACGVGVAAILFYTVQQPPRAATGASVAAATTTTAGKPQSLVSPVGSCGLPLAKPLAAPVAGATGCRGGCNGCGSATTPPASIGTSGMWPVLRAVLSNPYAVLLIIATSVRMIGVWVIASYLPLYYKRAFPDRSNEFSVLNAGLVSAGGIVSSYAGGFLADRFVAKHPGVLAWVPAAGALLGLGPMAVALYSASFYTSIFALFVEYFVAECWLGPGMSILQREAPRGAAGFSVALLLFCNTLLSNVGPLTIAAADPGTAAVRDAIFGQIAMSYVLSAGLFIVLGFMLQNRGKGGSGAAAAAISFVEALRSCPGACRNIAVRGDVLLGVASPQEMEELMEAACCNAVNSTRTSSTVSSESGWDTDELASHVDRDRPPPFERVVARPVSERDLARSGDAAWQLSI